MIDQGWPISLRLVNVPIAGRERDPSGCRASGLLPVHVVLVPPLLVPPSWPAVVVTSKLWTTAMYSRRIFSRFLSTPEAYMRMFNSDGCIAMKFNKIHFNSSKHNGYHVVYRPTTSKNARGTTISFMFRHCKSSNSFVLVFTYADELVAQCNGCASSTS